MTNSEKAFEEWGEKIWLDGDRTALDFASSFNEEEAKKLCRFIWASAIEFAAKMCEKIEQETWAKYKEEGCNPHQEGKSDGAGVCANEIRKQGAE